MKVCYEMDLDQFKGWSGAENTIGEIISQGKEADFECLINEQYPDGIDAVDLNDILRFEEDWLIEMLDLRCTYVVDITDIEWSVDGLSEETVRELPNNETRVHLVDVTEYELEDEIKAYLEETYGPVVESFDFEWTDRYL